MKAKNRARSKKVSLAGLASSIFGVSNGVYLRNSQGKYSANYVVAGAGFEQAMNNSADD
ncbi:MAG: hypothetical protein KAS70_04195 [Planctomycetes bacterium]|nr:hypothetical protein [Planctomycetota bacterium]